MARGREGAVDREVAEGTRALVARLAATWPAGALAEVDGDMEYGQFAEAVLGIMAVRRRDGLAWPGGCEAEVERLVEAMGIHADVDRASRHVERMAGLPPA